MFGKTFEKHDDIQNPNDWMALYGDSLYRFALSRIKDPSAAEDIVQETFLAAMTGYKGFRGRSALRTWLVAILKNKYVDHVRKNYREQKRDRLEYLAYRKCNKINEWDHPNFGAPDSPARLYARQEFLDTLHKCLSKLPGRLADVFIMREMDGLSNEKICESLDISRANCWVMLHRAKQRLQACVDGCLLAD